MMTQKLTAKPIPPSTDLSPYAGAGAVYPYFFPLPHPVVSIGIYLAVAVVYMSTLWYSDALYHSDPTPPLKDIGFQLLPFVPQCAYPSDIFAFTFIFSVAGTLLFFKDYGGFSWGLLDLSIGKFFSATLQVSTLIPESRPPPVPPNIPIIGAVMGGATDRLMSNHVFELGVALHIAEGLGWIKTWQRALTLLVFSATVIMSRNHYTVDIVLAFWYLALVGRLRFYTTNVDETKKKKKK